MDLHTEQRYDADPTAVFAMLTDETFIGRKTAAAKALRHEATVTRANDRVTIELTRVMPPDVPDCVRRFEGQTIDIKQVDDWGPAAADGSRHGTITLDMVGAPVTCTGTMTLLPGNGQTVVRITAAIKASVPLVSGKIESAVHQGLSEAAKIEEQVGRSWLANSR